MQTQTNPQVKCPQCGHKVSELLINTAHGICVHCFRNNKATSVAQEWDDDDEAMPNIIAR